MKRTIGLVLLLAAVASGANDFTGDPNCVALWRFESGALTTDSIGTNTLTDYNSVAEDLVNYREGACAADMEYDANQFFSIDDANLAADFPWKNGTTNYNGTVCCWVNLESTGAGRAIWSKGGYITGRWCGLVADTGDLEFWWWDSVSGYYLKLETGFNFSTAQWYHIGTNFQCNGSHTHVYIRVYSLNAGTTYWYTYTYYARTPAAAAFRIGGWSDNNTNYNFDGLIDEVVVFNVGLNAKEIDAVRAQTSTGLLHRRVIGVNQFAEDPNCKGCFRYELATSSLGTDTMGLNNLVWISTAPACVRTSQDFREGSYAVSMMPTYSGLNESDVGLPAGWPARFADADPELALSITTWFYMIYAPRSGDIHYICAKGDYGDTYSYLLRLVYNAAQDVRLELVLYYAGGSESFVHASSIEPFRWYHVGATVSAAGAVTMRIYDDTAGTILGTDLSSTFVNSPMQAVNEVFEIGLLYTVSTSDRTFGFLDETVVFNDVLTADEIDQIREGTYGSVAETTYHRGWLREAIRQRR